MTDASDINSVGGVMKLFFRELREPIFSVQYFDQFMDLARELFLQTFGGLVERGWTECTHCTVCT